MQRHLPLYDATRESVQASALIMACLTEPCPSFQRGACLFTRPAACFYYHTETQRRREVIGEFNQILYWDIICPYMAGYPSCSFGDRCTFSHTRSEICYHPARFRTKLCNGFECRGSVCCFAHSNQELRIQAPMLYGASGIAAPAELLDAITESCTRDDSSVVGSVLSSRQANGIPVTRLCASYPSIENCDFGDKCPFAHEVTELLTPLLNPTESEFYMRFFKTEWCVFSHHHDWNNCIYAHNSQDCRRPPSIGYGPGACSAWDSSDPRLPYSERCRHGLLCPFAHGRKEQLYHPGFYRTNECCDWRKPIASDGGVCIRGEICAFFHGEWERRYPQQVMYNYEKLLNEEAVNSICRHLKERPILVSAYPARQAAMQKVVQSENIDMNEFLKFALF